MERVLDTVTEQQKSSVEDGEAPAYAFRRDNTKYPGNPAARTGLSKVRRGGQGCVYLLFCAVRLSAERRRDGVPRAGVSQRHGCGRG